MALVIFVERDVYLMIYDFIMICEDIPECSLLLLNCKY